MESLMQSEDPKVGQIAQINELGSKEDGVTSRSIASIVSNS